MLQIGMQDIYIYIYIERERERGTGSERAREAAAGHVLDHDL